MTVFRPLLRFTVRVLLPILLVLVGVWLAYEILNTPAQRSHRARPRVIARVKTRALKRRDYTVTVKSRGLVLASRQTVLRAEVRGKVVTVADHFRHGASFAKGQALIEIDPTDTRLEEQRLSHELERAKDDLKAIDVELAELDLQIELALKQLTVQRQRLSRARALVSKGIRNREDLDPFELGAVSAEANLQNLKSRKALIGARRSGSVHAIALAQLRLKAAQIEVGKTTIKAPYSGRALTQSVELGTFVSPNTELATIFATEQVSVRLPLSSRDLEYIDLPDDSEARSEQVELATVILRTRIGTQQYSWSARMLRAEGLIDTETRQLFIVVVVDKPFAKTTQGRPPLRLGSFVEAEIKGRTLPNVYVIPRSTVRGDDELLLVNNGVLRRQKVKILFKGTEFIVVGEGISDDDELCVTPIIFGGLKIAVKVVERGS
jgi:hypothetical protein